MKQHDPKEELFKPKAGPGQVIRRESVPVPGAGRGTIKRYKNIAVTPIRSAFNRNQLHSTEELKGQLGCGQISSQERLDYGKSSRNGFTR